MAEDLLWHCWEKDQERCKTESPWDLQSSELHKHCVNKNDIYMNFTFKLSKIISKTHMTVPWGNLISGHGIVKLL